MISQKNFKLKDIKRYGIEEYVNRYLQNPKQNLNGAIIKAIYSMVKDAGVAIDCNEGALFYEESKEKKKITYHKYFYLMSHSEEVMETGFIRCSFGEWIKGSDIAMSDLVGAETKEFEI